MQNPLQDQDIELFAAGDHGDKGVYTRAHLDQIVSNYDPAKHEAPVVIGHPANNLPAFGWVQSLQRKGDSLFGRFKQVQPAFAEMVEKGLFKKRSVALYRKPEGFSLRHVGFLGAQPPEVKGLADVAFQDNNAEVVEITFQEDSPMDNAQLEQMEESLFERFKGLFTGKGPDKGGEFSEADRKKQIADAVDEALKPIREAETARATEFAEAQKKLANAGTKTLAAEAIAKVKASGRWVPAFDKMGLPILFEELAKTADVVEFGEGDAKKSVTPLVLFTEFMESLKKIVPTDPVYTGKTAAAAGAPEVQFSEKGSKADANSVELTALTQKLQAEKSITFDEALTQITKTHPHLLKPGGSTAGEV